MKMWSASLFLRVITVLLTFMAIGSNNGALPIIEILASFIIPKSLILLAKSFWALMLETIATFPGFKFLKLILISYQIS